MGQNKKAIPMQPFPTNLSHISFTRDIEKYFIRLDA
jgi:hypothetical protein